MIQRKAVIASVVAGAIALVAVFGAFTYHSVYAQTGTPGTPQGTPAAPGQPGFGKGGRGGGHFGVSDADLASALGITTQQLQTAEQNANKDALAQAVSQGLITQQQADQMSANGFFDLRRLTGPNGIDYNALLAKALGISADQLQAARQKAFSASVDAAVQNGTLTQEQADALKGREALENNSAFQSAMQSAYEAAVRQAVSSGVITQAQADAILKLQPQWGGRGGFGPGFGHGPRDGFGPGGPNGTPNAAPTQSQPQSGSNS